MPDAIFYDAEFLTAPGAPQRYWCGPEDPEPTVCQIGAVRLSLDDFEVHDRFEAVIVPRDRAGARVPLDPLLTRLTGLTEARIDAQGVPFAGAMQAFAEWSGDAPLWAWGRDDTHLALTAYVEGWAMPLPPQRFGNATRLLVAAGVPVSEIVTLRSNTLPAHFGLTPDLTAHDPVDDAKGVALTIAHLLREGRISTTQVATLTT